MDIDLDVDTILLYLKITYYVMSTKNIAKCRRSKVYRFDCRLNQHRKTLEIDADYPSIGIDSFYVPLSDARQQNFIVKLIE